jgi:hypothetical protein
MSLPEGRGVLNCRHFVISGSRMLAVQVAQPKQRRWKAFAKEFREIPRAPLNRECAREEPRRTVVINERTG